MPEATLMQDTNTQEEINYIDQDVNNIDMIDKLADEIEPDDSIESEHEVAADGTIKEDKKPEVKSDTSEKETEQEPIVNDETDENAITENEDQTEEPEEKIEIEDQHSGDKEWLREFRKQHKLTKSKLVNEQIESQEKDQRIQELEQRIKEVNDKISSPPQEEPVKDDAETVFRVLNGINNGDIDRSHLPKVNEAMKKLTSSDLVDVLDKIDSGFFGDDTDEILDLVNKNQARINTNTVRINAEDKKWSEWQKERAEAIKTVESFPDINDKNSEIGRKYIEATSELQDMIPDLKNQAKAPLLVLQHLALKEQAGKASEVDKLKLENEKLKQELNLNNSPQSSQGSYSSSNSNKAGDISPEDEFRQSWQESMGA